MDSLNPEWLSIELSSIDESSDRWISAVRTSYLATLQSIRPSTGVTQSRSGFDIDPEQGHSR
jgi:hypothetical protein